MHGNHGGHGCGPTPRFGAGDGKRAGRGAGQGPPTPRAVALGFLLVLSGLLPAPAAVRLELRIAEAETHVIGDVIPLYWRFGNPGPEPLGFLWEGCCRLNGRLEVRRASDALATAPPGQALAHMFAKADRLDPGVPKEYETRVSDWVVLPGTGTYDLQGTYRGVLPTQFPQVARGLALWRDAAQSPPIRLSVVGVADYLAQREARANTRGLQLSLGGPDRLPPLGPATFQLALENRGDQPRVVAWPDAASLWVLNSRDERVAASAVIQGNSSNLVVPPRGRVVKEFVLASDRFEGEPLADYRLFVDLAPAGPGEPRVPSTVVPLAWRLSPGQVADLVRSAARGAGTGARNAPLKLLRVYLAELGPTLAALDRAPLGPEGAALADRLSRAAGLKAVFPRPGSVELVLRVPGVGEPAWERPEVAVAAGPGRDLPGQLSEVLALRRHLGWEVSVLLEPEAASTLEHLAAVASALEGQRAELAAPPAIRWETGGTNAPALFAVAPAAASDRGAGPVFRVGGGRVAWSRDGKDFGPLPGGEGPASAGAGGLGSRVRADPSVPWGRFREALRPWVLPGARWDLVLDGTN